MINLFKFGIFEKMKTSKIGIALFEGTKPRPGRIYVPYGMFANIQEGIMTGVLLDQGNEESLLLMPFDVENVEDLKSGEIGFGIPTGKSRIYFRENGDVEIVNDKGVVKLKADGQFVANGFTVDP